ncbi:MAG: GntR family transcriptional regulator [Anaerolineales bacterium]|nr:GntR family transcriptional regulator [Anaerolineales bacterium]
MEVYQRGKPHKKLLSSQVADIVRNEILVGKLEPGYRIVEQELCNSMDISRGPVREALRRLEEEGYVNSIPHRGTFVSVFSLQDVIEVHTFRELVEPYVIERSLQLNKEKVLEVISESMKEMYRQAELGDAVAVAKAHTHFHEAFFVFAEHGLLKRMWDLLQPRLRQYLQLHQTTFQTLKEVPREHEKLTYLTLKGDVPGLKEEILKHLDVNRDELMAVFEAN